MALIIFIVAALAYLLLAIKRLKLALQILLGLLFAYLWRAKLLGVPSTFLEVMIIISFVVCFWQNRLTLAGNLKNKLRQASQSRRYPFDWGIVAWLLLAVLAFAVGGWTIAGLGLLKAYFLEPLLLWIVVFNIFGVNKDWSGIIRPLVISAGLASILAWYQYFFDLTFANPVWGAAPFNRPISWYDNPNALGLFAVPIVVLGLGWIGLRWQQDGRSKRFWADLAMVSTSMVLALGGIVFARSAGSAIGLLAGLAVLALLWNRQTRRALIVVIAIFILSLSWTPIRQKVWEAATLSNLSGEIRKQQWRETWAMLSGARFWTGAGLANYQTAVAPYHQPGIYYNAEHDSDFRRKIVIFDDKYKAAHWQPTEIYLYPHNILLNFWSELGLAGALLFVWLVAKYLTISYKIARLPAAKADRLLAVGLFAAMIALIVHGLVDVPYFKNDLAVLFWTLFALVAMLKAVYLPEGKIK